MSNAIFHYRMKDSRKHDRKESLVTRLVAEYIAREALNKSLVTVTRSTLSDDGNYATIFFSAFPEHFEQEVLQFLERKAGEVQAYVEKHARMGRVPFLKFAIDEGEKNRLKLETLSKEGNGDKK